MIIDNHVHISYLNKKRDFFALRNVLLQNMKINKISYSVVIPDNVAHSNCADLDTVINLTKDEPKLYTIGTIKISSINEVNLRKINQLFRENIIKGFKIFPGHDPIFPTDPRWQPIYQLCLKYGLPLIIHTGIDINNQKSAKYNDPKYIIKVARIHPKLKFIIAHYFWPQLDYCYSMTNSFNNIYFDISGLGIPDVISKCGGMQKIKEILVKTVKRRINSVIFGTDWPMGNVKKHINLINSLNLTKEQKKLIYYKNSLELFRLK